MLAVVGNHLHEFMPVTGHGLVDPGPLCGSAKAAASLSGGRDAGVPDEAERRLYHGVGSHATDRLRTSPTLDRCMDGLLWDRINPAHSPQIIGYPLVQFPRRPVVARRRPRQIADKLESSGFRTRSGGSWHPNAVRRIAVCTVSTEQLDPILRTDSENGMVFVCPSGRKVTKSGYVLVPPATSH